MVSHSAKTSNQHFEFFPNGLSRSQAAHFMFFNFVIQSEWTADHSPKCPKPWQPGRPNCFFQAENRQQSSRGVCKGRSKHFPSGKTSIRLPPQAISHCSTEVGVISHAQTFPGSSSGGRSRSSLGCSQAVGLSSSGCSFGGSLGG